MDDEDETDPGLAGLSPEFQAMVGGLAGHTASFAKLLDRRSQGMTKEAEKEKDDEVYLESYADLAIHEDMLKDVPRVDAYRRAIEFHSDEWKRRGDVSAVDVGSGTGLLAVFCARAGARRVVAVEASRLSGFLRQVAEANAPGTIDVQECRAEELKLPEGEQVDVVVSEWMGYCLLFENMLPSVLAVRDRYLKPGGTMLPSRCRLLVAPLEDGAWRDSHLSFWNNVQGIDMSAMIPLATSTSCEKPQHRLVPADGLLGPPTEVLALDLATCKEADLRQSETEFTVQLPAGRRLDGFVTWFDCEFGAAGWLLSTAPSQPPTHWRQTAFYLRQPIDGGGGISIECVVGMQRHEEYSRGYRVNIELKAPGRKRRMESFELR